MQRENTLAMQSMNRKLVGERIKHKIYHFISCKASWYFSSWRTGVLDVRYVSFR